MLNTLLSPKTIAVLGASNDPLKPGGRVLSYALEHGYQGKLFPISNSRDSVQGIPAYRSLDQLPEAPDLLVIALPEALIEDSLKAAGKIGTRNAIIFASGYAELGAEGRAMQERLTNVAKSLGIRLLGPNTQGMANFATGAITHFGTIIEQVSPPPSPIGVVSQSGAGSQIIYSRLSELGLGAQYLVATGNEADLDVADFIHAYAADEDIKLILVYAEALKSPSKLAKAALQAKERGVPILMVKAGRTASGQETAASHTGALASEDRLVDVFLEKYGIVRVADFEELAVLSQIFLGERGRPGRRVTSISNSGASCVLSADAIEDHNLILSRFDTDFKSRLAEVLPAFIAPGNPIDMTTATLKNPDLFQQILERLAAADNTDMVFVGFPIGGKGYDFERFARELSWFSESAKRPVVVSVNQRWAVDIFRQHRIPVFSSERRAVAALAVLADYHERIAGATQQPPAAFPDKQVNLPSRSINEAESMEALALSGLPVVRHQVCVTAEEVIETWASWGHRKVVLKGVSDTIAHKSEHGLVRLGLEDEAQLRKAASELLDILSRTEDISPRLLLAEQVASDFELMAGAHYDPVLGSVVAIGRGGVLVEALNDIQFIPAPLTHQEAIRSIKRLDIARAFQATRGMPAVNLDPLADILVKLGEMLTTGDRPIASLDLNPILVRRGDYSPVIVDALIMEWEALQPA